MGIRGITTLSGKARPGSAAPAHRACQRTAPRRARRRSRAPGNPRPLPPGSSQVAPGPWLSAHCPPGRPAGHDAQLSTSLSFSMAQEQPSFHSQCAGTALPMPLSFVLNVKTGFNTWWSITHLVTPAQKKGSLRKDRNWYFLSLSPHPEAPEPLLTPSPLPHQSTSARAPQHWPCHPKSQHPYPTPIPTQAAPISPKDRGSPKTPLARIQVWPYPGVAGRQPGGLHRPAGDSACGHHLRQDGSVIVLLVIVRMPGTEARMFSETLI